MSKNKLLTDVAYAALKAKDKEYRKADIPGLYMKVQTSGKKSWQLRLKNNEGKWTWVGLGSYPEVSVKAARSQAFKYQSGELQIVTRSERIKQAQHDESELFEYLMRDWIDTKKNTWELATFKKEVQSIEKHLLPVFGKRKYKDITSGEWLEFFQKKQRVNKTFNRIEKLISYCRNAYDLAVFKDEIKYNPLIGIQKFLDKTNPGSMKYIHIKELPEMVEKIREYRSEEISIGLELLIHMFPRPGELRQAKWEQFDFEERVWIRPSSIMKRRIEHGIPLSDQVINLLTRLKSISKRESDYLFPARDSVNKSISNLTFNAALNRLGYFGKQNPHGFRHIASTKLNDKFSDRSQVIESALAHVKTGVKAAYDKGAHLEERFEIMQYWSDYLDQICGSRDFSKAHVS
ncbi:tyrosine-type recombinase/integrase [Acinetobacter indicus]|uniref:tyrosine-type recombinase/integrase n=1 Tax=Acinetobacter indicus TaxID=756892 RepID=UPI000CECB893|nr:tyrosine-type recombinase/integrase [Acinetobacter indicus]